MDRNLQIALVSSVLAIVWGYGLRQRLRIGDTQIQFKMIYRRDNSRTFWTIMLFVGMIEAVFIGMAITYFAAWLQTP